MAAEWANLVRTVCVNVILATILEIFVIFWLEGSRYNMDNMDCKRLLADRIWEISFKTVSFKVKLGFFCVTDSLRVPFIPLKSDSSR